MAKHTVVEMAKNILGVLEDMLNVTYSTIKKFNFDWNYDFFEAKEHINLILMDDDGTIRAIRNFVMGDKYIPTNLKEIREIIKKAKKKDSAVVKMKFNKQQIETLYYVLNMMPIYFRFVFNRFKEVAEWYTREYTRLLNNIGVDKKLYGPKGVTVNKKVNEHDAYGMEINIKHPVCETEWYKYYMLCHKCLNGLHTVQRIITAA